MINDPVMINTTLPYMDDLKRIKFRTTLLPSLLGLKLRTEIKYEKLPGDKTGKL